MRRELLLAFGIGTIATSVCLAAAIAIKVWREAGAGADSAEERAQVRSQIVISIITATIMTFPIALGVGLIVMLFFL